MEYYKKQYIESRIKREEERIKIESYGRVKRWAYETGIDLKDNLKDIGMILKAVTITPVGLLLIGGSSVLSYTLSLTIAPKINEKIPYVGGVISGLIVLSPIIVTLCYLYYKVKKELAERRGEY